MRRSTSAPRPLGAAGAYVAMGVLRLAIKRRPWLGSGNRPAQRAARTARLVWRRPAAAISTAALLVVVVAGLPDKGVAAPGPGETVLTFLDVGQGDATLVQRDGAAVLFDTGPPDGPIVARLREVGVERLDALVLTHGQADHEGAAVPVVERFRPRLVVDGGAGWPTAGRSGRCRRRCADVGARARAARPPATFCDSARSSCACCGRRRALADAPPEGDPNQRAIVVLVRSGGFDAAADRRRGVGRDRAAATCPTSTC